MDSRHTPHTEKQHDGSQESNYWAEFYSRNDFLEGSTFFEFVNDQQTMPSTVIDIGCGDGRDSFAFARAGKKVVGLDRSEVGVDHAEKKARGTDLDLDVAFAVCDVSDKNNTYQILEKIRKGVGDEPVCFYMRFFLHSIPEDVQDSLMETLSELAQPGDALAVEFRTDKDEDQFKTFGTDHYRRYQNAEAFSTTLRRQFGWNVSFETESTGLSVYETEDPVLYRALAYRDL